VEIEPPGDAILGTDEARAEVSMAACIKG